MNKEAFDKYTCGLEMEGGYHGHPYPQKFMHAPKSCYPEKNSKQGEAVPASAHAMKISMGR